MNYGRLELESCLSVEQAVLVTNYQMRHPFAFVDQQSGGFCISREIENRLGCVGLAGPQGRRQRLAAGLRVSHRPLSIAGYRVRISPLIDDG
jgi:hypothetical protein